MPTKRQKGAAFEREICVALSRWVTDGKRSDVFWRTAMSGGRATRGRKRGEHIRQSGDITAVAPEGHALCDEFYLECKFHKDLQVSSFMFANNGGLARFWVETKKQARSEGKEPILIFKQNNRPVLVLANGGELDCFSVPQVRVDCRNADIYLFSDIMLGEYGRRS